MRVQQVGRVFGILYRHELNHLNSIGKGFGLSALECIFLMTLLDRERVNLERLSSLLVIDKSATSKVIKLLVLKEFVLCGTSEFDHRSKTVDLTEEGRRIATHLAQLQDAHFEQLVEGYRRSDIETTLRVLGALTQRLSRDIPGI